MSKLPPLYIKEKIEAYNVAIDALRFHESESDVGEISKVMRNRLAAKLENEISRWCDKHTTGTKGQ